MADKTYKDNKDFIAGKFHAKYADKISCWIPKDKVQDFVSKATNERGDLTFVIAKKRGESKSSHYAYVSKKAPAIPNFEAPPSLESQLAAEKPQDEAEQNNNIPF